MKVKKVISLLMAIMMVIGLTAISASASELEDSAAHIHDKYCGVETESSLSIQPKYAITCPGASKHAMFIKGQAFVYMGTRSKPGSLLISKGVTYQCQYCRLVVASQYNVTSTLVSPRMLGYYVMYSNQPTMTGMAQVFYCNGDYSYNSGGLASDSFWRGFDWYWAG